MKQQSHTVSHTLSAVSKHKANLQSVKPYNHNEHGHHSRVKLTAAAAAAAHPCAFCLRSKYNSIHLGVNLSEELPDLQLQLHKAAWWQLDNVHQKNSTS
jgi:hypothetical protein